MPTGIRPKSKRVGLEEWKTFITEFTSKNKIREVYVSGGEPTMVKYLPDLVNWILDKGFHVIVFTNLFAPERLLQIKKSYRFKIQATFHSKFDNAERFDFVYKKVSKVHRVDVDEIESKVLPYSKSKPLIDMDGLKDKEIRVSPDLEIFDSCYDHFLEKSK